jgi:hypothetical protein
VYTLKSEDHQGFKSLKKLYLDEEDITEYRFANKYLDSYEHWKILLKCTWFKPLVESWREELKLKLQSRLYRLLYKILDSDENGDIPAIRMALGALEKPKEGDKTKKSTRSKGRVAKTHRNASNSFLATNHGLDTKMPETEEEWEEYQESQETAQLQEAYARLIK